jgi:hypothetical protein
VERAFVLPPHSQIGPLSPDQRQAVLRQSRLFGRYEQLLDRESAFEKLKARADQALAATPANEPARRPGRPPDGLFESMAKSAARAAASQAGRQIMRGILGSIFGRRR